METTSKKVAAIAGKISAKLQRWDGSIIWMYDGEKRKPVCTKDELQSVAASALTQSPDSPKKSAPSKPLDYPRRRRKS